MMRLGLGEFHRFRAAGRDFVYLVPSAAVFGLSETAAVVLDALGRQNMTCDELSSALESRFAHREIEESLSELLCVRAICEIGAGKNPPAKSIPPPSFPLSTLVLNVTSHCNLSCTYCYEYGEDRIVSPQNGGKPKFLSAETARESVDFLLKQSGKAAHLTFFGGETLLNFPVIRETIQYARRRAAEAGKEIDFSLTTNATLLRPEIIEFLAENRVGVTISMDGPRELQDRFRVFHDGSGTYDTIAPKVRDLIRKHRTRPIGARVTLTSQTLDIQQIYRHLTEEFGFWEVGFAPVTTSAQRLYAIGESGFDRMLEQFRALAQEFLECALENKHHGFSNVRDSLEEIHKGANKAYPCGAGLGLLGAATDGEIALCHRFAGSPTHRLGTVRDGIDRAKQRDFLERNHIAEKTDCSLCWARPLCSGGCYHEAHTRYGSTTHPNLHYCEWIRGWTDACLQVYGEIAARNPQFLEQFDERGSYEASHAYQH